MQPIAAGLEDAIAFAEGDTSRARAAETIDVAAIRAKTKKSHALSAKIYRLPLGTLRDWEQHRRQRDAPVRVLLSMIDAEPETVEKLITKVGASA